MADPELGNLAEHEMLATVALLRQLAAADGVVSPGEVRELSSFAEAIGPERWDAFNRKLEQERPDEAGLRELASAVENPDARELIFGELLALSMHDTIDRDESKLLDWLQASWELEVTTPDA